MHAVLRIETGGLKGRVESWDDLAGRRYVDRYELGPASGASGFDGGVGWEQDSSGQVLPRESAEAREASIDEAYRRSRAFWFPARWDAAIESAGERTEGTRRFRALKITPKGGRPFELWIDASSFLPDRTIEKGALETRTEIFSDYREVRGIFLPFATRSTNGNEKYDQFLRMESVELNAPVADAAFAVPPPPAPDFSIASGKTSTTLPFSLVNNHIYVTAFVNGKPYRLLCDTGGANVLTPSAIHELGLRSEGALEARGVGEKSEDIGLVRVERLQIGDATLSRQLFAVFDLSALEPVEGAPMSGLVGFEVFKRFVVRIDYGRHVLTLTPPAAYREEPGAVWVPFRFKSRMPQMDGEIDGIPGLFDIDTGSRASLDLLAPFAEKHRLADKYGAKLEAITGWGVGGPARAKLARAKTLKLGSVEIRDLVTELSLQKKGAFTDVYVAGNVGAGVLRRFVVTFDYARQRVGFEPVSPTPARDSFDRAGMWINRGAAGFEVMDVIPGGPAGEAGIKPGDRITGVDGTDAARLSLSDLRLRLRTDSPGTRVRVKLISGGTEREATIVLRDLV
jgi:hypothetical protein